MEIHPTAIVHPKAKLAKGVTVGPYSLIGENVTIGENSKIGSFCVLEGRTTIGKGCEFFTGAIIGSVPQDKKFNTKEKVFLEIGDGNIFREYVTVNPGTGENGKTTVGHNNLFMVCSHIAHDCRVGNDCVIANNGALAGHVTLEDKAVIGGLSAVHQFVRLGKLSIVGGCSKAVQDVPPFSTCDGHPAKVFGLNTVGLRRAKMSIDTVNLLKKAFKILFLSGLSKSHALEKIEQEIPSCPEIAYLVSFVKSSERGLCS